MSVISKLLRLKGSKKSSQVVSKLVPIYVGQDGTRFFSFKSGLDMPMTRAVAAEASLRVAEWGLSKDRLRDLAKMLVEQLQNDPPDKMVLYQIATEISIGLESVAEEEALYGVAACLFLIEGEPEEYVESYAIEKIKRWKKKPDERAFFLSMAWQQCRQFKEKFDIDILNYLQNAQPLIRSLPFALKRLINSQKK